VKAQVREHKRRDGKVMAKRGGGIVRGAYKLKVRKDLLRRLLTVQKRVRAEVPNPQEELISAAELHTIRRIWRSEAQDWEDSVPKIVREVLGDVIDWPVDEQPVFSTEERRILDAICERHDVPSNMVAKLLDVEREYHGMNRRSAIHKKIAAVLEEDWRSEEEVLAQEFEQPS
jgi:DNA sulfur modification protein DndC